MWHETVSVCRFCTMPGSGEGWPHGSQDLEGCRFTLEEHGGTTSAAVPAVDSELLPTQCPCSAVPYRTRAQCETSVCAFYATLVSPAFSLSHSSMLSSLLPFHIWQCSRYLASFCSLYPRTGRMEVYLHVMSAAGAGGKGGTAGTAPRGIAAWLLKV